MKIAFILAACAALSAAAVTESQNFATTEAMSLVEDVFAFSTNPDDGLQRQCGGLTPSQCRRICGQLGYRCWRCTGSACICSNTGC
ncbi:uncharacterized protein BDW43DRAFT_314066 [Aspergillus alliaceus]|uniref:uncharacterized protein n=1 Tax=Petromyces alliaceus TaxID=209559 RepID=UPI0012A47C1D|nr:uncharacterized protein BDW43DRAFT_314066 [Aspergillus alliaceus]KAB8230384.1 hypothetical protein BDW43DRAFT_314066 [Aspergillus alliaceus]